MRLGIDLEFSGESGESVDEVEGILVVCILDGGICEGRLA